MNKWHVELDDLDRGRAAIPLGLTLRPVWWSWRAAGGPDECQLEIEGTYEAIWEVMRWLRWGVRIVNANGTPVWWGYVDDIDASLGTGLRISLSLAQMYNRVAVAYTYEDGAGSQQHALTSWGENTDSSGRYGAKELRHTLSDTTADMAEATRDELLRQFGLPRGTPSTAGKERKTVLRCKGFWHSLAWNYYENLSGKEGHQTTGGALQSVGAGTQSASTTIGFRGDTRRIFNIGPAAVAGSQFIVSGSASNNTTFEVGTLTVQTDETVTDTSISFSEPGETDDDDIYDSNNGLGVFLADDVIQVEGSTSNDGIYTVGKTGAGAIEILQSELDYEEAGDTVTIRRRSYVAVKQTVTEEDAGASVSIKVIGERVAQSFTQEVDANWTVAEIAVRVKKVGNPTDNFRVALFSDDSGSPGAELDYGTVAASELTTSMNWVSVALNNTDTISYGTTYWIVLSRTGDKSLNDCYMVDMDEDLGFSHGGLKLYNGSTWVSRLTNADMPFVVWGQEQTTDQLETLISNAGGLCSGADVADASGVYSRQYRDGESLALDEAEDLLAAGTSSGGRLLAEVRPSREVKFYAAPSSSGVMDWTMYADGRLMGPGDARVEPGLLPAGQWLRLGDLPGQLDEVAPLSPVFIERATYSTSDESIRWEPEGAPDPWSVGEVVQG
jgi:hypothetical protein